MSLLQQGGPMMWPLLGLSVTALGVIMERFLVFSSLRLPDSAMEDRLCRTARQGNSREVLDILQRDNPVAVPLVEPLLGTDNTHTRQQAEQLSLVAGKDILFQLDRRLSILSTTARVAPLLGLLGTVLGMIQTFSRMSDAQGAVDMTALAGGIWQALLTTAAGLAVAIPALLAHQYFVQRRTRAAFSLQRLANLLLTQTMRPQRETPGTEGPGQ